MTIKARHRRFALAGALLTASALYATAGAQPIYEGRSLEPVRRCATYFRGADKRRQIVINADSIRHDSGRTREPPGKQRGVSGCRFGDRVIVVGVGEPGTATRQPRETIAELRPEAVQVVASELVYGNENDERRRGGRAAIARRGGLAARA